MYPLLLESCVCVCVPSVTTHIKTKEKLHLSNEYHSTAGPFSVTNKSHSNRNDVEWTDGLFNTVGLCYLIAMKPEYGVHVRTLTLTQICLMPDNGLICTRGPKTKTHL